MATDIVLEDKNVQIETEGNNGEVHVKGWLLVVEGGGLILDAKQRRHTAEGWRLALVHGNNDELAINRGGNYPGGVTIESDTRVHGTLGAGTLEASHAIKIGDISLEPGGVIKIGDIDFAQTNATGRGLQLGDDSASDGIVLVGRGLQINGGLQVRGQTALFDHALQAPDITLTQPPSTVVGPDGRPITFQPPSQSLLELIEQLQKRIEELEKRL